MRRTITLAYVLALSLSAGAADAAEAAEPSSKRLDALHRIAVVNGFDAPMVVYAEDAEGALHEVATLEAGEVRLVETELEGSDEVPLRLHARPTNSVDRWSTWGHTGIVTDPVVISEEETAIFWIAPDLAESKVEIRFM